MPLIILNPGELLPNAERLRHAGFDPRQPVEFYEARSTNDPSEPPRVVLLQGLQPPVQEHWVLTKKQIFCGLQPDRGLVPGAQPQAAQTVAPQSPPSER